MGICSVLTIIFVVLKVTGITAVATWSWPLVLSPLIAEAVITGALFIHFARKTTSPKRRFR